MTPAAAAPATVERQTLTPREMAKAIVTEEHKRVTKKTKAETKALRAADPETKPKTVKTTAAKTPKPKRPECGATKKDGQPCTASVMAIDGNLQTWCTDHRPGHLHLSEEERIRLGDVVPEDLIPWLCAQFGWGQVQQVARKMQKAE